VDKDSSKQEDKCCQNAVESCKQAHQAREKELMDAIAQVTEYMDPDLMCHSICHAGSNSNHGVPWHLDPSLFMRLSFQTHALDHGPRALIQIPDPAQKDTLIEKLDMALVNYERQLENSKKGVTDELRTSLLHAEEQNSMLRAELLKMGKQTRCVFQCV
jgi:hypothetical protein